MSALNALGGLASGIAQGLNMGMQWRNQKQYLDLQKQYQDRQALADDRDAEIHSAKMDQYNADKEIRVRRQRAMQQIADYTQTALGGNQPGTVQNVQNPDAPSFNAPPEQQTPSTSVKLAGPIPPGSLAMNQQAPYATDNPAGALAPTPQQAPAVTTVPPSKVLERGMVTGAYSPEMLTNIANIFTQNGLHDEGTKYMNQAYEAQKRGVVTAAMAFMQNNPGAAASALKQGGVNLESMPVKAKPNDTSDHNWKINIAGQGEQTINVKDWLQSTMDPDKFFEVEDKKRKAILEERKQANDDRETSARIGYLNSRSNLADAKADTAGSASMGSLRPSRSSEAQINTALARRDKAYDRVTSEKNDEGKFEVNPQKRQELDSASNQYQTFLEDQLGEELDARQHHKFTDAMATYPVGGTPAQIKKWQQDEFLPRFGGRKPQQPGNLGSPAPAPQSAPPPPTQPPPGSLAGLQSKGQLLQQLNNEMTAVQQALKTPGLDVNQKKALALKAQDIATRRDVLK